MGSGDYGERSTAGPGGPWQGRVRFGPGGLAYTPGRVLVPGDQAERAAEVLAAWAGRSPAGDTRPEQQAEVRQEAPVAEPEVVLEGAFALFEGVEDTLGAVAQLRRRGVRAQPDHVLFATCCCPPHPASAAGRKMAAEPYYADAVSAQPYYADPYYADPYYADPYYADAGGGCGCCCGGGTRGAPYYADPYYADPYYADAPGNPALDPGGNRSGRRRSSARPAGEPGGGQEYGSGKGVRVAIVDTGWAQAAAPPQPPNLNDNGGDEPDEDGDRFLDPAAGHGTFIAGIIERLAPGCTLDLYPALTSYGDGKELDIATLLLDLATDPNQRPDLVNLSFGGYSPIGFAVLAHPIAELQKHGVVVVSSAGNDGTCRPSAPAALPGVVGVAALNGDSDAAPFTNYGWWVRACTFGQDVVSWFYDGFNGGEQPVDGVDPDDFGGWARWSGTSFAAPRLVARLAAEMSAGASGEQAVASIVDDPNLTRKPLLGTHVP